jgi:hypothetical protein
MKNPMIILVITSILLAGCDENDLPAPPPPSPETKNIEFAIGAGADYSAATFADVNVAVELNISFLKYADGATTKVWDTAFVAALQSFQRNDNPIRRAHQVINPRPDMQQVQLSYVLRYYKNGKIGAQAASGVGMQRFEHSKVVQVNL